MEWNGTERNGTERNGSDRNGTERNGTKRMSDFRAKTQTGIQGEMGYGRATLQQSSAARGNDRETHTSYT